MIAIAGIVGLSSCSKDYVCSYTDSSGEKLTVNLTNDDATICGYGDCNTLTYDEIKVNDPEITDKKSAKNSLEDEGYTCK